MPSSNALSIIAKLSVSLVWGPKFIVPRHSRLTCKPVRPRWVYSTAVLLLAMMHQYRLSARLARRAGDRCGAEVQAEVAGGEAVRCREFLLDDADPLHRTSLRAPG